MKAIIWTKYGSPDVLQLKDVDKPVPGDNEVLVKVHAASLNAADFETLRGTFIIRMGGPLKPMYKIPGSDIAGRVESVGIGVEHLHPGDEVFGDLSVCGFGAFAEYVSVPENVLALKPACMTFEQAATLPQAAILALQSFHNISLLFLKYKGQTQPGLVASSACCSPMHLSQKVPQLESSKICSLDHCYQKLMVRKWAS